MMGHRNRAAPLRVIGGRTLTAGGLMMVAALLNGAAPAPASRTYGFVLSTIYVAAHQEPNACKATSPSSADLFLQSLSPAERAQYGAPEKVQDLQRLMAQRLGFKMVPTGVGADQGGGVRKLTPAEEDALRAKHQIPAGKGAVVFLGQRFAYDSCTNPDDFPMLATGNEEYRGKVAFGIDLDGRSKSTDYRGVDGAEGVDNALYRATGCNFATKDFGDPAVADNVITSQAAPTLVEVSGVDDLNNDKEVTVRFFASSSPIEQSSAGKPIAWTSLDIDPNLRFHSTAKGQIKNGVLTTTPFDLRFRLKEQIVDSYREVRKARLRATIRPDESIEGGIFGYHTIASIAEQYVQSTQVGANLTKLSCPALLNAIQTYADAFPDPRTKRNTAISSALRFRGVPAFLVSDTRSKAASVAVR